MPMKTPPREIRLAALRAEDAVTMCAWRNDPEVMATIVGPFRFVSLETEREWNARARAEHEQGKRVCLGIRFKDDDSLIGVAQLTDIDRHNRKASTAMIIGDKAQRGQGYGQRAYGMLISYAFNELGLHSIRARMQTDNPASKAMLLSVGFKHEGTEREVMYKGGRFIDLDMYSLLRTEFTYDGPGAF